MIGDLQPTYRFINIAKLTLMQQFSHTPRQTLELAALIKVLRN